MSKNLQLCYYFGVEKCFCGFRRYRVEHTIYRYAHTLLTFVHTESAAELNFVAEVMGGDKLLKLFHYPSRAFDMA